MSIRFSRPHALRTLLHSSAILAATAAGTAHAQLEEVVVTAQKREQSMQTVPVSVTAFDSESMKNMSMRSVPELLDFTPNAMRASGPNSSSDTFFFFRGVGQIDNNVNVDPGVGVYIDEVYLGRLNGSAFELSDMQRVEILRGPQGTFFGRNTIGGAVSMVTKDPGEEMQVEGQVVLGERERRDVYLGVDGPVTDTLGARLSVFKRDQEGWAESVITGDTYGDTDEFGGRVKFVWDPTERLRLKLGVDYTDGDGSQLPTSLLSFNDWAGSIFKDQFGMNLPPVDFYGNSPLGVPFPGDAFERGNSPAKAVLPGMDKWVDPDPFDDEIYVDAPGEADTDRGGIHFNAEWDANEHLNVTSITAWRFVDQLTYNDLDATPYHFYNAEFSTVQDQFSQELRFAGDLLDQRLNYTLGLYYFEEDIEGITNICLGTGGIGDYQNFGADEFWWPNRGGLQGPGGLVATDEAISLAVINDGRCLRFGSKIDLDVESYATFGQFEYSLTDKLTGIVGFRYTYEEKEQEFETWSDNTQNVGTWQPYPVGGQHPALARPGEFRYILGPNNPNSDKYIYNEDWEEFSPSLGLDYQYSDDVLLYVKWTNGFKSGGFGGRANPGALVEAYDPETIETYELGIKSEWFDRKVRLNAAYFYSIYEDVQLLVLDTEPTAELGNAFFTTFNGGENHIQGVEVELTAMPTPALVLNVGIGYIDSEWDSLNPDATLAGDTDFSFADFYAPTSFDGAPYDKLSMGDALPNTPDWTFNAGAQYTWMLGQAGDFTARVDYSFTDAASFQPDNDPYEVQGSYSTVNVRATWAYTEDLSVAIYGTNVLDEEYFLTMFDQQEDLGTATATAAPGPEWGVEFNFRFY